MPATAVIGAQWGDEGKGKIVDYLGEAAEYIVRFQGGPNAGHTVTLGPEVFKLHVIPSGILRPGKLAVVGNGVVVDPEGILEEIEELRKRGVNTDGLRISDRAQVILSYHRLQDGLEEELKGASSVGTTRRGIGPVYADKVARLGIRMCDLIDPEALRERLEQVLVIKERQFQALGAKERLSVDELVAHYVPLGQKLAPHVVDASILLDQALDAKRPVLFEGAQGVMLDVDHGTYPYVTSSNTVAGNFSAGAGICPMKVDWIIGVAKAYTTRVGAGPFPTELTDDIGRYLAERGAERGTTTGRLRRCGWLDLVALRHAARVSGFDSLAITKLDVLSGLPLLKVCVAYERNGERIEHFPANLRVLREARPVYQEMPGWRNLSREEFRAMAQEGEGALLENMRRYLRLIEQKMGLPVELISLGPDRADTIHRRVRPT